MVIKHHTVMLYKLAVNCGQQLMLDDYWLTTVDGYRRTPNTDAKCFNEIFFREVFFEQCDVKSGALSCNN
jgi:hypothetical protein